VKECCDLDLLIGFDGVEVDNGGRLAEAIGCHVLSAETIFADCTPVQMLARGTGKTQAAQL
jgi:hypothetical protein